MTYVISPFPFAARIRHFPKQAYSRRRNGAVFHFPHHTLLTAIRCTSLFGCAPSPLFLFTACYFPHLNQQCVRCMCGYRTRADRCFSRFSRERHRQSAHHWYIIWCRQRAERAGVCLEVITSRSVCIRVCWAQTWRLHCLASTQRTKSLWSRGMSKPSIKSERTELQGTCFVQSRTK